MAEQFLVSIQLDSLDSPPPGSLALISVSYLGRVYFDVLPSQITAASTFLQDHFGEFSTYCNATALPDIGDLISLLDNGATKIFVTQQQLKDIVEGNLLEDLSRLVLSIEPAVNEKDPALTVKDVQKQLENLTGNAKIDVHVRDVQDGKLLDMMQEYRKQPESYPRAYFPLADITKESYSKAIQDGQVPIVPASTLTVDVDGYPKLAPAAMLITSLLKSDRQDGLYPTIVSNERGVCLGLVYSSVESIHKAIQTGAGVYYSRSHKGLWVKGATSGDTQELIDIRWDCDADALQFTVKQKGTGFCHLQTATCFGPYSGLSRLEGTLQDRKASAPAKSYTARLFRDPKLLQAKIMEEASELCEASSKEDIAAEAADLLYFALAKCIAADVDLAAVERNLDLKSMKTTRRKGDAKPQWAQKIGLEELPNGKASANGLPSKETVKEAASIPKDKEDPSGLSNGKIQMRRYKTSEIEPSALAKVLQRPSQRSTDQIMNIVNPIIKDIQSNGDAALLKYTHKFEKATSLTSPVLNSPFPESLMRIPPETISAIDTSFENIRRFHAAQQETKPLQVETMPGVSCSRFSRPIERVGLYVPGGTAVLPSTALMLGVPAMVAGCKKIVLASPPRPDGTITPEIVYIAHKVGAAGIVLAGGAQAIAALAYGTESVPKVDKILGPGNQFVTAAKMIVSNDTSAGVGIDMPAGPSEVLVVADKSAEPAFVASDLLSQAEHGSDSQVVLIAVGLGEEEIQAIEAEVHAQASALPRVDIVRGAIAHSVTLEVGSIEEAMRLSNQYAPEHLILQVEGAERVVAMVENAGSVFVGAWTPESVGDYSAGVNHSLPTYGYAKQYSGVNLSSFTKHITSSTLTREGLQNISGAVMQLAKVEELEAHRRAVSIRLEHMEKKA
ncbi:trifunctional histidinol dehydrogenase [Xanthoria calcicola]